MRQVLLVSCAVFLSLRAAAQSVPVEKPTTGNTAVPGPVIKGVNTPATMVGGGVLPLGSGLQTTLGGALNAAPGPRVNEHPVVNPIEDKAVVPVLPVKGAVVPSKTVPVPAKSDTNLATLPATKGKSSNANAVLDRAVRGIIKKGDADAVTGQEGGPSLQRRLNETYDASRGAGDIDGAGGGVSGRVSKGIVANSLSLARKETLDNAIGLYADAIGAVKKSLTPGASPTVVARASADLLTIQREAENKVTVATLSKLVQDAFIAAAAGDVKETNRLAQRLDQVQEQLDAPDRPLIVNGAQLKIAVQRALSDAGKISGAKPSAPRGWVVARGGSYVAALPGTPVEKIPGLAAPFALTLETLSALPIAAAYRTFVARPGVRTAVEARTAMGESVPAAVLGTGWLWLKHLVLRAWHGLLSLLPGRGLPTTADVASLPRLRAAASSWRDAVVLGERAAHAAGAPRPIVARVRGAFALARRAAAAHEALTGEAGAVARIESLVAEFEAGVARAALAPSNRLTPVLESLVAGEGGLRHWAARYAADARERGGVAFAKVRGEQRVVSLADGPASLAAPALLAASSALRVVAFEEALWAAGSGAHGAVKLFAELRSTESGGAVVLETERADERLARRLDALGFAVTRVGRGLRARLDAETASVDAEEMSALAADVAALITGASPATVAAEPGGLDRLLFDVRRTPGEAAKKAVSLDGSSVLWSARTVAQVGELEAVVVDVPSRRERVFALRDHETRLPRYARIEPLPVK
jgi:hypothetical protein